MRSHSLNATTIAGLLVVVASAAVSLGCPGSAPTDINTSTDIVASLRPLNEVDSIFVVDTITAPQVEAISTTGTSLIVDIDWASSNPSVLRLIGTSSSKTGQGSFPTGGRFASVSEGDAIITGTLRGDIKTLSGQSLIYRKAVSVAGPPKTLKISTPTPYVLQVLVEGVTNPAAFFETRAILRSSTGRAATGNAGITWSLVDVGPAKFYESATLQSAGTYTFAAQSLSAKWPETVYGFAPGVARLVASLEPRAGRNYPVLADTALIVVGGGQVLVTTAAPQFAPIEVGETKQFVAQVKDATGIPVTSPNVRWSTSRSSIATIDQAGVLTALNPSADGDTVSVLAYVPNLGVTGRFNVTIYRRVASVVLSPSQVSVGVSAVALVKAAYFDAGSNPVRRFRGTATWSVVNGPAVATFSAADDPQADSVRRVYGETAGDAFIKLSYSTSISATVSLHVFRVASSITLALPSGGGFRPPVAPEPITVGSNLTLIASAKDPDGLVIDEPLTFSTTQQSLISIAALTSGTARITGLAAGTATVTVTSSSNINAKASMTVLVSAPVTGGPATRIVVTSSPANATIGVGGTVQYSGAAKDANGQNASDCPIGWGVDRSAIGNINATGLATGVGAGTSAVRAYCTDNRPFAFASRLTVIDAAYGASQVNVTPRYIYLTAGQNFQFTSAVTQSAAGASAPVTWSLVQSSANAATFDPTGRVSIPASLGAGVGGGGVLTATAAGQTDIGWFTYGNAGSIRGNLVSTSGQFLGGSSAIATPTFGGTSVVSALNNDGYFYLIGLAPGSYTVTVSQQGNYAQQTFFGVIVTAGGTTLVSLAPFN